MMPCAMEDVALRFIRTMSSISMSFRPSPRVLLLRTYLELVLYS